LNTQSFLQYSLHENTGIVGTTNKTAEKFINVSSRVDDGASNDSRVLPENTPRWNGDNLRIRPSVESQID